MVADKAVREEGGADPHCRPAGTLLEGIKKKEATKGRQRRASIAEQRQGVCMMSGVSAP